MTPPDPVWLLAAGWGFACALPVLHRAVVGATRHRVAALRRASRARGSGVGAWVRARRSVIRGGRRSGPVGRVLTAAWRRLRARDHAEAVERGAPLALDLLTMAARAGYTPRLAVAAAARWSPPVVGSALQRVEQRCVMGAVFTDTLTELGREEPALRSLTDALAVAERSGAPVAELLGRVADDARAGLRRRAEAHARRVPVRLLFPLVFLVLPAFGLLTVVPALVAGLRHT